MLGQRILVLGCSGSGKSTFARRLGALMDLPVVHLDRLYLKPGWAMDYGWQLWTDAPAAAPVL